MKFQSFSKQQRRVLTWWLPKSPESGKQAVICDGAVRSGKTLCMGISFFCWAMAGFNRENFAICGKTIGSVERNVLPEILPVLREFGFQCSYRSSEHKLQVRFGGRENLFFLFGGRDEGSADLIQGMTLAGVLLDEVVLMPRNFVEQALARCSVAGSKFWFSCNPDSPQHWFYREWIEKAEERRALYLHFTMSDNPGLHPEIRARYERLYAGVFYQRFVLGKWVATEGQIYDFFSEDYIQPVPEGNFSEYRISCDYGTTNPASFGLWGEQDGVWYRIREYYFDSRRAGRQCTDQEYVEALKALAGEVRVNRVIVDPSAASFIQALRQAGFPVEKADNHVLRGIRVTANLLKQRRIVICSPCKDAIREFGLYRWDSDRNGQDAPVKENDHAMDDIRYFATALSNPEPVFAGFAVERQT